jgi:hypothetical protein
VLDAAYGESQVYDAVRASIDKGVPVLMQCRIHGLWVLLTG